MIHLLVCLLFDNFIIQYSIIHIRDRSKTKEDPMEKICKSLQMREKTHQQQLRQLRQIITRLSCQKRNDMTLAKSKFEKERTQLGCEIQGLVLEIQNLKNKNAKLKEDAGSIMKNPEVDRHQNEQRDGLITTIRDVNSRLLNTVSNLQMKNKKLEETVKHLFDYDPDDVPMTPERGSKKKKHSMVIVDENPRKSLRLTKRIKKSGGLGFPVRKSNRKRKSIKK